MRVKVRAYCSSANLGPGFDVLAVALDAFYDEVQVEVVREKGVRLVEVTGPCAKHVGEPCTAVEAAKNVLSMLGANVGLEVRLWKGVPVGKGLGSSGASAAAAALATSLALGKKLDAESLVEAAGKAEGVIAGSPHYDNVSASLLGGLVMVLHGDRPKPIKLGEPSATFLLAVPDVEVPSKKTGLMRKVLPRRVALADYVRNASRLAALIAGMVKGDFALAGLGMEDCIVERARAPYVPGYQPVRAAALSAGALGVALSGAGPSVLILAPEDKVESIAKEVKRQYASMGIGVELIVTRTAPAAHGVS